MILFNKDGRAGHNNKDQQLKCIHKYLPGILLLTMISPGANAQTNNISFTNYNTTNGLCYNNVFSVLQDSRGFMWFGTGEGLSRFDGTNFKNFYANPGDSLSMQWNSIGSLLEYKKGHLIFVTGAVLCCMNTLNSQFYQPAQFKGKMIDGLSTDKKGHCFITVRDTCFLVNDQLQITDTIFPPTKNKTDRIYGHFFEENTTMINTKQEMFFYDLVHKTYQPIPFNLPVGEKNNCELRFFDTRNKYCYFSRYGRGLYKFSLDGQLLHHWGAGSGLYELTNGVVASVAQKDDSTIWVGTIGSGLNIINTNTNVVEQVKKSNNDPASITDDLVRCIYKDRESNIWIGTNKGISKLNNTSNYIKSWHTQFLPGESTRELLGIVKAADRNFYLSFYGGNTYKLDSKNGLVSKMKDDPCPGPWSMHNEGDEIYETGAGAFITSYNTTTGQYKKLGFLKKHFDGVEIIVSGFRDSRGDQWYSGNAGHGFVRIGAKDGSYHVYKKDGERGHFDNSYYFYHTETPDGDIWFGVNKSSQLLHWNRATDHFDQIDFARVPGSEFGAYNGITTITSDNEGRVWVGFEACGVIGYDPASNTAARYTIREGLSSDHIGALQFDGSNRLWIGTTKGISCLLADRKKIINFKKEDGLPEDNFPENCSYFDSSTNRLWLGAYTTLMCFDPGILLSVGKNNFPIYIDGLLVNGKQYAIDSLEEIKLSASQNNLQFQFIGVDLANGKDIEYSYRLLGADREWIDNGSITSASYANLNSGDYTFKVRARHKGDNVWTELRLPLRINIATPWFRTRGFVLLVLGSIAFLIWFIIRAYYLRRLEKQKAIIEQQLFISKERSRIAADMHDDMGAGLSRMRYLSAAMKNETIDEKQQQDLDKLITGSDELVDKMNDIIWTLSKNNETLEDTLYYIRSQCSEMLDHAGIGFECSLPEPIPPRPVSGEEKRNLYLAVKETVHNTIKHSGATKVRLEFTLAQQLRIVISDNGTGFDVVQNKLKGNGIGNLQKRIAALNGNITFHSDEKGTTVSFEIPLP